MLSRIVGALLLVAVLLGARADADIRPHDAPVATASEAQVVTAGVTPGRPLVDRSLGLFFAFVLGASLLVRYVTGGEGSTEPRD